MCWCLCIGVFIELHSSLSLGLCLDNAFYSVYPVHCSQDKRWWAEVFVRGRGLWCRGSWNNWVCTFWLLAFTHWVHSYTGALTHWVHWLTTCIDSRGALTCLVHWFTRCSDSLGALTHWVHWLTGWCIDSLGGTLTHLVHCLTGCIDSLGALTHLVHWLTRCIDLLGVLTHLMHSFAGCIDWLGTLSQ